MTPHVRIAELSIPENVLYRLYSTQLVQRLDAAATVSDRPENQTSSCKSKIHEKTKVVANFLEFAFNNLTQSGAHDFDRQLKEESDRLLNLYFRYLKSEGHVSESTFNTIRSVLLYDFYPTVSDAADFEFEQDRLVRALPTWHNTRQLPAPRLIDEFEHHLRDQRKPDGTPALSDKTIVVNRKIAWGFAHWVWEELVKESNQALSDLCGDQSSEFQPIDALPPQVQRKELLRRLGANPIATVEAYCKTIVQARGPKSEEGSRSVLYKWFYPYLVEQGLAKFDRERITILPEHMYLPETPRSVEFEKWTDFLRDRVTGRVHPRLSKLVATKYRGELRKLLELAFESVRYDRREFQEPHSVAAQTRFSEIIRERFDEFASRHLAAVAERSPKNAPSVKSILDLFNSVILRGEPFSPAVSDKAKTRKEGKASGDEKGVISSQPVTKKENRPTPPQEAVFEKKLAQPSAPKHEKDKRPVMKQASASDKRSKKVSEGAPERKVASPRSSSKAQKREAQEAKVEQLGREICQTLQDELGLSAESSRELDYLSLRIEDGIPVGITKEDGEEVRFSEIFARKVRSYIEGARVIGKGQMYWNSANTERPLFYFFEEEMFD
ncbi:MAG: hypothetical protein KDD64_12595 [Bdellovibrionales bacterium]|nr:hypothetical protein [Bdellovibrionales bacterium]